MLWRLPLPKEPFSLVGSWFTIKISLMMPFVLFAQTRKNLWSALYLSDHARTAWSGSNIRMLLHSISPLRIKDWLTFFMNSCQSTSPPIHPQTKFILGLTLRWDLWKTRNDFKFEGTKLKSITTILEVSSLIRESTVKPKKDCQESSSLCQQLRLRSPRGTAQLCYLVWWFFGACRISR